MAKRRRYDDQFRAKAVVMLEAAGYPDTVGALTQVAAQLKVPAMTISRWFNGRNNTAPNDIVKEKREDLKSLLENEIRSALHAMTGKRGEAEYRELGTVFGILFDKLQLLKGEATERHEIVDLSDAERAKRINDLLDTARARRAGQSDNGEFVQ